jgi:hypothetical protein
MASKFLAQRALERKQEYLGLAVAAIFAPELAWFAAARRCRLAIALAGADIHT